MGKYAYQERDHRPSKQLFARRPRPATPFRRRLCVHSGVPSPYTHPARALKMDITPSSSLVPRASIRASRMAPMGPRSRQSSSSLTSDQAELLRRTSTLRSTSPFSHEPASTPMTAPRSSSSTPSPQKSLPKTTERPALSQSPDIHIPEQTPPQASEAVGLLTSTSAMNAIVEEGTDDPPGIDAPSYSPDIHVEASSPAPSHVSRTISTHTPVNLSPAPKISFDSIPIPWKGLPLEAALCVSPSLPMCSQD